VVRYGIEGRIAVITGAAGGIGAELVRAFSGQGAHVVLIDRDAKALARIADSLEGDALEIACDLNDDRSVARAADRIRDRWGCADILVNNAGMEYPTPLNETAPDFMVRWEELLRNNVGSMVRLTRALLPFMGRGSCVINQSSIWGLTGVSDFSAYAASKHAVIGVTRSLAWELAASGIRVNAICPGWVRTDAAMRSLDAMAAASRRPPESVLEEVLAGQAVPTLLEPTDVTGPFLFLASQDARAITGQSLVVSHGEVMH
jgi:3-hydroxybutyrate dehydrogenase